MALSKKVVDNAYHILLECGREQYAGKGETLAEAFADMDKPKKVYRSGVFTFKHGEKTVAKVVSVQILRRIFGNTMQANQWIKLYKNI